MIYRKFAHAKSATVLSVISALLSALLAFFAAIAAVAAIALKLMPESIDPFELSIRPDGKWIAAIIAMVIGAAVLALVSSKVSRKLAEAVIRRKIKKSERFAYRYCKENPHAYRYAASLNRDFASRYTTDQYGQLTERRKK